MSGYDISYGILSNLRTITFENVIIYENIWLGNVCNLVGGRYIYTYNNTDNNIPNENTKLNTVVKRYKMKNFIYRSDFLNEGQNIFYSTGSIWLGEGSENSAGIGIDRKIDIQTIIRGMCRQEIEYALWNFIIKLKENNVFDGNPSDLRLRWFHNIEYPSNNITTNGFPIGTDDTEFPDLEDSGNNIDESMLDNLPTETEDLLINNQS